MESGLAPGPVTWRGGGPCRGGPGRRGGGWVSGRGWGTGTPLRRGGGGRGRGRGAGGGSCRASVTRWGSRPPRSRPARRGCGWSAGPRGPSSGWSTSSAAPDGNYELDSIPVY